MSLPLSGFLALRPRHRLNRSPGGSAAHVCQFLSCSTQLLKEGQDHDGQDMVKEDIDVEERLNEKVLLPNMPYYIGQEFDRLDGMVSSLRVRDSVAHALSLTGYVRALSVEDSQIVQEASLHCDDEPRQLFTTMDVTGNNHWATGSDIGSLCLWKHGSGTLVHRWARHHTHKLGCVQECASFIFTGGHDGYFKAVDVNTQDVVHGYTACACPVQAIIGVDAKHCWTGTWDGKMRLLDLGAKDCAMMIPAELAGQSMVRAMALDTENQRLFAAHGSGYISCWDLRETSKVLQRYPGHKDAVTSIAVTPTRLYSASDDQHVRVFDVEKGASLDKMSGHTSGVTGVVSVNDSLLSCSLDGAIRRYDLKAIEAAIEIRQRRQEEDRQAAEKERLEKLEQEAAANTKSKGKKGKAKKEGKAKKGGKGKGKKKGKK